MFVEVAVVSNSEAYWLSADTDDTNRVAADTRTIHWLIKMARLETVQMLVIGRQMPQLPE
jgi:hypothetical protein